MSLHNAQHIFTMNLTKLVQKAQELGLEPVLDEVARTIEQQTIYFKQKKSKTMNSLHLSRLAADMLCFKNEALVQDSEILKPLAEYWESLHPDNKAGWFWGWDYNHYSMIFLPPSNTEEQQQKLYPSNKTK